MPRLFGTDGVRGVANQDLTPELAFRLGRALVGVALGHVRGRRPRVVLGRDTRASGPMLASALLAGIQSGGSDVILLGVAPTPAVAFLTVALQADAGAVISASHNPAQDNGIKFFSGEGRKFPDAVEEAIEAAVFGCADGVPHPTGADVAIGIGRLDDGLPRPAGTGVGRLSDGDDALDDYLDAVAGTIPGRLDGLRLVLDCANGAAYDLAPRLFRQLGAWVTVIGDGPDGDNINRDCGSTQPEALRQLVVRHGADAGIAFDGDADRCLAVDERGNLVDGDHILAVLAVPRLVAGTLPGGLVVGTVLTNFGLDEALRPYGGRVLRAPVGDRYVLEEMLRHGARLGGEQSGHLILLDHQTTGDGLLTAVQLLWTLRQTGRPLSELAGVLRPLPQTMLNVRVTDRLAAASHPDVLDAVARVERELAGRGRVVLRPSGTEPVVRVMVEAPEQAISAALAQRLAEAVARSSA